MCGIAGYYCYGNARPTKEIVDHLWDVNEYRGKDATGAAWQEGKDRKTYYVKAGKIYTEFKKELDPGVWKALLESPVAMLHCRAKTRGSEQNNLNNHPTVGYGWNCVHNGTITNDNDLFDELRPKERIGEVDSMALNAVLAKDDKLEDIIANLATIGGTASFAAWKTDEPQRMLLGRVGSNTSAMFHLGMDNVNKILYFCSEYDGLWHVPSREMFGIRLHNVVQVPMNSVLVLEPGATSKYEVGVNPFFRARIHTGPPGFLQRTGTGTGTDTNRPVIHQGPATRSGGPTGLIPITEARQKMLSIEIPNDKEIRTVKYGPHLDNVKPTWFGEPPDLPEKVGLILTYATAYGTWIFKPGEVRQFKPHGRVRKYWEAEYKDLFTDADLFLPLLETEKLNKVRDDFVLEEVILAEKGWIGQSGLMCPWCGVMAPEFKWQNWRSECRWCCIKSVKPPTRL